MNYILNEAKMFADITDEMAIVINSETGIYYGLGRFATSVFSSLISGSSEADVADAAAAIPGVPSDFAARLSDFAASLLSHEIVVPAAEGSAPAALDAEGAAADSFAMEVVEYNDAVELLLADPIHEVKEVEGWSPETSSLNEDKEDVARREAKFEQ